MKPWRLKVDVTITACRRPKLLEETLHSFVGNLLKHADCRCIINIDPVGPDTDSWTLGVAETYFDEVVYNTPKTPNFGRAFKWCWEQVEAPWTFHLEDDWRLEKKISLMDLHRTLEVEEDLALLRLPQFVAGAKDMKNWNLFYPWNGRYYECPSDLIITAGFCGHPSLIKSEFVKNCVQHLDPNKNPEKQFHVKGTPLVEEVLKWRYGVYSRPGNPNLISDLGRRWMIENKYRKKGAKATFMEWEKVSENEK